MSEELNMLTMLLFYELCSPEDVYGDEFKIRCPFHEDPLPSMGIILSTGRWYCYGCGASGYGAQAFIGKLEAVNDFKAMIMAKKILKGSAELNREVLALVDTNEKVHCDHERQRAMAAAYFDTIDDVNWRSMTTQMESPYMFDRGFEPKTLKHFNIKLNPSSVYEIITPIMQNGRFMGWVGRRQDGEEPKFLYNKCFSRRNTVGGNLKKGPVLVVESYFDMMMAHQFGFSNGAALLGWSCSEEQAEILKKKATQIICATDNDQAGEKGFVKLQKRLGDELEVVRFKFPKGKKDIGDLTEEEFNKGFPK